MHPFLKCQICSNFSFSTPCKVAGCAGYPILGVNARMGKKQKDAARVSLPHVTFFLVSKLGSNLGPHPTLTSFGRRGARLFGARLTELSRLSSFIYPVTPRSARSSRKPFLSPILSDRIIRRGI